MCAPVLTVYSFFSDTLSPCPANWKQKEKGGQGGQKNTEKSTGKPGWTLQPRTPSFFSKTRLWLAKTRRLDSAVLRGRLRGRLPRVPFPCPKGAGFLDSPGAGWSPSLHAGWGEIPGQEGLPRAALGASPEPTPTPDSPLPLVCLPRDCLLSLRPQIS